MNFKDLELMNQSFGNLQDTILRNRMMETQDAERKQARADRGAERAQDVDFRERELAQRAQLSQGTAQQRDTEEHRKWLETLGRLNAGGNLDDEQRASINQQLQDDPRFKNSGIHFQFKAPVVKNPMVGKSAIAGAVQQIATWRQMAQDSEDPDEAALYNKYADTIEKNLPSELQQTKPLPPTKTTTTSPTGAGTTSRTTYTPTGTNAPAARPAGKALDDSTARAILKEVGGDKDKARALARQRGFIIQ